MRVGGESGWGTESYQAGPGTPSRCEQESSKGVDTMH